MTIKNAILDALKDGQWHWSGELERVVHTEIVHKGSTVSRRCRELENDGKIERRYVEVESVKTVQYRLTPTGKPQHDWNFWLNKVNEQKELERQRSFNAKHGRSL